MTGVDRLAWWILLRFRARQAYRQSRALRDHVRVSGAGFMLVPLIAKGGRDIIPAAGAAIHTIGNNRSEHSEGGAAETDRELVESEPQNDALLASVLDRRARIVEAKLRLAKRRAA